MFSLVASLGKYAFRIQNPYLFIDCSIETVLRWYTGEVENGDIAFTTHRIWINRLAIRLQ